MQIEQIEYKGWPNCWRMSNGEVELVITGDVGPRILQYGFIGGRNFLKNFAHEMGTSGESTFVNRGGSRIWIAPEDRVATYAADNFPVRIETNGSELIATAPVEPGTQLEKQMVIRIGDSGTGVEIVHRVRNAGLLPVEFSIWVLAVMEAGGTGISGFPPRGTHPEHLAPSNPLVMWAFTDLTDPRWKLLRKYLVLHQDPALVSPQKLGHCNAQTWGAYLLSGELFLKRCGADLARAYPDLGCSFEMFANGDVLELETLSPLERVRPGQVIEHIEYWSLHRPVTIEAWTDEQLDGALGPILAAEIAADF